MKNELTQEEIIARGMQQHVRDTDAIKAADTIAAIFVILTLSGLAVGGLFGWLLAIPSGVIAFFFLKLSFKMYFK